jgi:hypothetical protein
VIKCYPQVFLSLAVTPGRKRKSNEALLSPSFQHVLLLEPTLHPRMQDIYDEWGNLCKMFGTLVSSKNNS